MPKYNVDEQKQLSEAIELTIGGKEYKIEKITTKMVQEVTEMAKSTDLDVPIKQLAYFVGADPKEFEGIDMRLISSALEFITKTFEEGMPKSKNPSGVATP